MKKASLALILSSVSIIAYANPGCGVGAMIWKDQAGVAPHVLAATTNSASFGNQTFGMTTGTLGCNTNQSVRSLAYFIDSNIDRVARDMSRGQGENLETLAVLLGVEAQDRDSFKRVMQENFAVIFPTADTTSDQAVVAILDVLKADTTLSKYAS